MKKDLALAVLSVIRMSFIGVVCAQTLVSPQNTLQCRSCSQALSLADCTHMMICDATLEECYMDQILTAQNTIVYNGDCRAKDACARNQGGKRDQILCSQCCGFLNDCNSRLCGIKVGFTSDTRCYSCDPRTSDQGVVNSPKNCFTMDVCLANEVCYIQQSDVGSYEHFFYGCQSKVRCSLVMSFAYRDHRICVMNDTSLLDNGVTLREYCYGHLKRATSVCHSCCGDSGCNYGSCMDLNERIFKLADAGKFDWTTMKMIP